MNDGPSSIIERLHDPKIQRLMMINELSTHLIEAVEKLCGRRDLTVETLARFQSTLEREAFSFCRDRGWDKRELPLRIFIEMNGPTPFMNLEGPLAYEIAEGIVKYTTLGNAVRPLSAQWADVIEGDDDDTFETNDAFTYDI